MTTQAQTRSPTESPVSNVTYDLMQALTSKLEAIEVYGKYRQDAQGEVGRLFEDLQNEDRRQAERLLAALRSELR
jgi:hypothetical protein